MSYQVVWGRCNVFSADGEVTTLRRGEFVPEEIDETQKAQLATFGATRFVDVELPVLAEVAVIAQSAPIETESVPDNPDEQPVGFVPTGLVTPAVVEPFAAPDAGVAPSKGASKPEWEDYAVSRGMSRDEAENTNKAGLIARYGG